MPIWASNDPAAPVVASSANAPAAGLREWCNGGGSNAESTMTAEGADGARHRAEAAE